MAVEAGEETAAEEGAKEGLATVKRRLVVSEGGRTAGRLMG